MAGYVPVVLPLIKIPNDSPLFLKAPIRIIFPEIMACAEVAVHVLPLKSALNTAFAAGFPPTFPKSIAGSIGSLSHDVKVKAVKIKNNPGQNQKKYYLIFLGCLLIFRFTIFILFKIQTGCTIDQPNA